MPISLLRPPDAVDVQFDKDWLRLEAKGNRFVVGGAEVFFSTMDETLIVELAASVPVRRLRCRWRETLPDPTRFLGDHWERGYGDLEWRGFAPDRVMPWYVIYTSGDTTGAFGVKTRAAAICHWQVDADGITLQADVRNGNAGVELGDRVLVAAEILSLQGRAGQSAFQVATQFCGLLCDRPLLPAQPVYGGNDWYSTYGQDRTHAKVMEDAKLISSLADNAANRPFMVIDDGWQLGRVKGPWIGHAGFPDMPALAAEMKAHGARPGLWVRPLFTTDSVNKHWVRFSDATAQTLDPSIPDVLHYIAADFSKIAGWGFELIKHDFSTFDLLGRWGFEMSAEVNAIKHPFTNRNKTTAEIMLGLYDAIGDASGKAVLIGCNTVGHLAAGRVHLQRTGDDTSGRNWERTRRMGINTLAFRMPQHNTFFAADADCVGVTNDVPWDLNRQWLQLLSASGTPLFVSPQAGAVGPDRQKAIRTAFDLASQSLPTGEPLDWQHTTAPRRWTLNGVETTFNWHGDQGAVLATQELNHDNIWWK